MNTRVSTKEGQIVPINKDEYHENFEKRAHECKEQAGWKCEQCGTRHGDKRISKSGELDTVSVQAAHVNHDPMNPDAVLICLCESCHLKHDGSEHGKKRKRTVALQKVKKAIEAGQLAFQLFEEALGELTNEEAS